MTNINYQNAIRAIARRCLADCRAALSHLSSKEAAEQIEAITTPIFARYGAEAKQIGFSQTALKFYVGQLSGQISERR